MGEWLQNKRFKYTLPVELSKPLYTCVSPPKTIYDKCKYKYEYNKLRTYPKSDI